MKGMDKFREHFAGYEDQYALIGGAACDLLFGEAGLPFRATRDLDIVLCVEVVSANFAKTFAAFIDAGGYQAREKSSGGKEFFRFHKPSADNFPHMLELFARAPETLGEIEAMGVSRIPVEEDVISLSAILLDNDYYAVLTEGRRIIDSIAVLDESLLIPFKARAYLDLVAREATGEKIDGKAIKKHRSDVVRLSQLLPRNAKIVLPAAIQTDLSRFLDALSADDSFEPKSINVPLTRDQTVELLRTIYRLPETQDRGT